MLTDFDDTGERLENQDDDWDYDEEEWNDDWEEGAFKYYGGEDEEDD